MSFETLGLNAALIRALADAGYEQPTDVQAKAIPPALQGQDLRVSSSTGSGKTASFALPALQRVLNARGDGKRREKGIVHGPRVLVLAPTRELALQVAKAMTTYGRHVQGLRVATVVGGVPYGAQLKALRGPLDVLIATPGRLIDHLGSGKAVLANVEMLILDEADRMLDMGFIDDIHHIAEQLPPTRQTVMYSATFAGHVGRLAEELLKDDAQTIAVASHTDTHEHIEQRLHWADNGKHKDALLDHILTEREVEQAVVFTSTQRDADWLAERLAEMGHAVASLHGGMPQGRRNRVLQGLRMKQLRVLVATDVAARGIDVPTISHVINYGLPMKAEDYVHRIGRTGRAGRSGLAVTLAERRDLLMIKRIQQFTTQPIPVATVAGLEPQQPEPRIFAGPPRGRPGAPGRPAPHGAHKQGGRGYGPRPDDARGRRDDGFVARDDRGFAPRRDGGFAPRRDEPAFAPRRQDGFATPRRDEQRFAPRTEGGFAPRRDERARPPVPHQGHGAPRRAEGFTPHGQRARDDRSAPRKTHGAKPARSRFGDGR